MLDRPSMAKMTADEAQEILKELTELEFPKFMGFSIVFALFKTYGIPSISSLLLNTGELANGKTASKRIADTGVLLLEFALNKPSSGRSREAIARMNYLHSRYIKAGKISNADMLYTLSVFALEPVRWVNQYEWREFTELELCACGTYWKALGDAMDISFDALPSSKEGWTDGLHWLDEVRSWSAEHEAINMVPAESNSRLAHAHLDVLFINVPQRLVVIGKKIVGVLLGERIRRAMILPKPDTVYYQVINLALISRKLILRYLTLPRPELMRKDYISSQPNATTGRYSAKEYLSYPWYVTPTFMRRWGPHALIIRLLGRKLPGDDGNCYLPEGYLLSEVGPSSQIGRGSDDMESSKTRISNQRFGTCPFQLPA
ncbi:MAG: hypothetical protein M1831_007132 [Alyxoria varia]|nr:MAG: hypothetical protein M1831_007132 [Alyxoria varia]